MEVGLYFELENPPHSGVRMSDLYGFVLEMCEEAEHLGAQSVWFSEHHLFQSGFLPQPLTFCAAVAARTKRIRVGTAVVVAPFRDPVHLAEEAAVVDLISGGRLELGLGAGYRVPEYQLFGADIDRRYSATDHRARELRRLWSEGGVTPLPAQERVPIWMGYMGPQGARRAGLLGEALLTADAASWEPYRAGLLEGGHGVERGRMAGGITGWITDDPEGDWPIVSEHLRAKYDSYRAYAVEGTGRPSPRPVDPDKLRAREIGGLLRYFLHATPEEAAHRIRAFTAGAPIEAVHVVAPVAGMSFEMVARHVQTVCTRLAPLLAEASGETTSLASSVG